MLKSLLKWIHRAEEAVLALLLLAMIVLASADILMRLFTSGGLVWVQPLVKIMVLWLGLLGALLATRDNQHISIDLLSRMLGEDTKRWARSFTSLFAAIVCGVAAWHSVEFVSGSLEFQDTVNLGKQDVPAWIMQIVIPVSLGLMALRFSIHCIGFAVNKNYQASTDASADVNADKLEEGV